MSFFQKSVDTKKEIGSSLEGLCFGTRNLCNCPPIIILKVKNMSAKNKKVSVEKAKKAFDVFIESFSLRDIQRNDPRMSALRPLIQTIAKTDFDFLLKKASTYRQEPILKIRYALIAETARCVQGRNFHRAIGGTFGFRDVLGVTDYVKNELKIPLSKQLKRGFRKIINDRDEFPLMDGCGVSPVDAMNLIHPKKKHQSYPRHPDAIKAVIKKGNRAFAAPFVASKLLNLPTAKRREAFFKEINKDALPIGEMLKQTAEIFHLNPPMRIQRKMIRTLVNLDVIEYNQVLPSQVLKAIYGANQTGLGYMILETALKDALALSYINLYKMGIGSPVLIGLDLNQKIITSSKALDAIDFAVSLYKNDKKAEIVHMIEGVALGVEAQTAQRYPHVINRSKIFDYAANFSTDGASDVERVFKSATMSYKLIVLISTKDTREAAKLAYKAYKAKYGPSTVFHIDIFGNGTVEKDGDFFFLNGFSDRIIGIIQRLSPKDEGRNFYNFTPGRWAGITGSVGF